jgi:phosphoesterase RecJ-like protein
VLASILLGDLADGRIRVNLRSKSPEVTGINVDVSAVAAQLGGGGHQRAAGARVTGTMAQVYPVVLEHMLAAIRTAQATPSQCPS